MFRLTCVLNVAMTLTIINWSGKEMVQRAAAGTKKKKRTLFWSNLSGFFFRRYSANWMKMPRDQKTPGMKKKSKVKDPQIGSCSKHST